MSRLVLVGLLCVCWGCGGGAAENKPVSENASQDGVHVPEPSVADNGTEKAAPDMPDSPEGLPTADLGPEATFEPPPASTPKQDPEEELLAKLEKMPNDDGTLLHLAHLALDKAELTDDDDEAKQAVDYLRRALAANPKLEEDEDVRQFAAGAYFAEACALSREEKAEEGLKALQTAVSMGWNNYHATKENDGLEAVLALPEAEPILAKMREEEKKLVEESIADMFAEKPDFEFDFDAADSNGKQISKKDYAGKVVVANIWGTWCGPCIRELPALVGCSEKFKSQGVEFVGFNCNEDGSEEEVNAAIREAQKEYKIPYPCINAKSETLDQVPDFNAVPTTLFIDRSGKVVLKYVGGINDLRLEAILEHLLKDSPTEAAPAEEAPAEAAPAAN